jgi:hypothetical protein
MILKKQKYSHLQSEVVPKLETNSTMSFHIHDGTRISGKHCIQKAKLPLLKPVKTFDFESAKGCDPVVIKHCSA